MKGNREGGRRRTVNLEAIITDDPEGASEDTTLLDVAKGLEEPLEDGGAQGGEPLDDLLDKIYDVGRGLGVRVTNKLHEGVNDGGGDVRKLDGALVNGLDEDLPVLGGLLVLLVVGLAHLLLQEGDDVGDVLGGGHLQGNGEALPPDLNVRAGQGPEEVHDQVIEDAAVPLAELGEPVEDDELDIVVALLQHKVNVAGGGGPDGGWGGAQGDQGGGALVPHGARGRVEELEDAANVLGLLGRGVLAHLPDQLDDHQLEVLPEARDLVNDMREVLDGPSLVGVEQHQEGVPLAGHVRLLKTIFRETEQ